MTQSRVAVLVALAACIVWPTQGRAEGPSTKSRPIVVRSIGQLPNRDVVEFVARNAEPTVIERSQRSDGARTTARQLIESVCGSVQDGYASEFARANSMQHVNLDEALGGEASAVKVPACLYARNDTSAPFTYMVKENDTLTGIRQRFTGAWAFEPQKLDEYFVDSPFKSYNAQKLKPGAKLPITLTTAATLLSAKSSNADFMARLKTLSGSTVMSADDVQAPGDIVGPVIFSGGAQGTFAPCVRGDGSKPYPFSSDEVAEIYSTVRAASPGSDFPVSLVVMDNGFFGAHCPDKDNCPEMQGDRVRTSDRFPNELFAFSQYPAHLGYGPTLSGTSISPLNFWNKTAADKKYTADDINEETGHGTHVTGLTLGGPQFLSHRQAFFNAAGKPWLTLIIANLSAGSPKLALGSDQGIFNLLQPVEGFKVVNMSVAFVASVDPTIASHVQTALDDDGHSLFVAAAGNQGANLDGDAYELYPARLGGGTNGSRPNVITVASIDGPTQGVQRLSAFSNRSAKYADIAAPGCRISSWLDADRPAVEVSGTSQAAPLVSFTMTLLHSLWQSAPAQLKNRALYSGDLLDAEADRNSIWSQSQLNMGKALTYLWDRVTYRKDGRTRTKFGKLSALQGLKCLPGLAIDPARLKAFKRAADGRVVVYSVDTGRNLRVCEGQIDPSTRGSLHAEREWVDGKIKIIDPANISEREVDLSANEIVEIVKAL
jgi:subtilisin family serine protease